MEVTANEEEHLLRNIYHFWRTNEYGTNRKEYENGLEDLGRCGSVEEFYRIYCYLPVIGTSEATNYSLFKEGIEPLWEDPSNRQGGRSTLQISGCDLTPILWEKLLLYTISESFNVGNEICGVSVTVKNNMSTLSVWNRSSSLSHTINEIKAGLRSALGIPDVVQIKYKFNRSAVVHATRYLKKESRPQRETKKERIKQVNRFSGLSEDD